MRNLSLGIAAAMVIASAAVPIETAQAEPAGHLIFGVDRVGEAPGPTQVQYFWGGRNYCWYDGGWRGPGWYWCGYAWRRGHGWGGPYGWRGWHGGHGWHRGGRWHDGGDHGRGPGGPGPGGPGPGGPGPGGHGPGGPGPGDGRDHGDGGDYHH
ncbi:MAG: hypothetical protein P4L73_08900 [Caulobacteraceae bacterium]|nr:hypothetical protein [Caulobacteraceae bacterium]